MTERDTPNTRLTTLRSLTPEQFLAQFADQPGGPDSGSGDRQTDRIRASGPVERGGRPDEGDDRLDGDGTYLLSAQFAVPETSARPPLPPTPEAAGRDREIPPIPPRSVLQLTDDHPADH